MTKKLLFLTYVACISLVCSAPLQAGDSYWLPKSFNNAFQSFWQWEHRNTAAIATTLAGIALWSWWRNGTLQKPSFGQANTPEQPTVSGTNNDRPSSTAQQPNAQGSSPIAVPESSGNIFLHETIYNLFGKEFIVSLSSGSITESPDEAIVNAANPGIRTGGTVSGAIFGYSNSANPGKLDAACAKIRESLNGGVLKPGEAEITPSFFPETSPIRHIIHALGPQASIYAQRDPQLLKNAYVNSLRLAQKHKIKSITFPLISAGMYGFTEINTYGTTLNPVAPALQAFKEFAQENQDNPNPQRIRLFIYKSKSTYDTIKKAIKDHHSKHFTEQIPATAIEK